MNTVSSPSSEVNIDAGSKVREPVIWMLVDKNGKRVTCQWDPIFEETGLSSLTLAQKVAAADKQHPENAPHKYEAMAKVSELTKAKAQAKHWKANHDNQVEKSRVLLERPDMPLTRVRAYHTIERLQDENTRLRNKK